MLIHCDPCCPPPTCDTTFTVTVLGCASAGVSGVTVSIKVGGSTIASGSTNGSGVATIVANGANGTSVTVELSGIPTGYATPSNGSSSLNCGTRSVSFTLVPLSTYACVEDNCCPQGGSAPYLKLVLPGTLTLTDSFGDITLTGGPTSWNGSATRPADPYIRNSDCTYVTGDVTFYYNLSRLGSGSSCWSLSVIPSVSSCSGSRLTGAGFDFFYPGNGATASSTGLATGGSTSNSCSPTVASITVTFQSTGGGTDSRAAGYWVYGVDEVFALAE
jgi:hypothetical protein